MAIAVSGTRALSLAAKLRKKRSFTPFSTPTSPPPGTYDPGLDAALRASRRGYGDLQQDVEQGGQRAQSQYATDLTEATQNRDRSLADTLRQYAVQGASQGEAAASQGVSTAPTLAASLAARTANQDLQTGRINQDYGAPDTGIFAKLQTAYQYGADDRASQLARAGRELGFFGQDTGAAQFAQAAQSGYVPPVKPKNESGTGVSATRLVAAPGDPKHWLRVNSAGKVVAKVKRSK